MIVFEPLAYLAIATAVWLVWRIALWRWSPRDAVREVALTALFLWSLCVVLLTFFPLVIVLYDWHGSINLLPFASIVQLLTETNPAVAQYNILGNVALFVPFGVLLPLLFVRLRAIGPLLWRVALISLVIEVVQLATRARATDIDDVILNTIGAGLGFIVYTFVAHRLEVVDRWRALLVRIGAATNREPLLAGSVPILATTAIVAPMMLSTFLGATLGDGADGILSYPLAEWPTAAVVARTDVGDHTFLTVADGPDTAERVALYDFVEVLPGRFTWVGVSEMPAGQGSRYNWTLTSFNIERNVGPVVAVWGTNNAGAETIVITGNGASERLAVPEGSEFVVAFQLELDAETLAAPAFENFAVSFLDVDGIDVSHRFEAEGR